MLEEEKLNMNKTHTEYALKWSRFKSFGNNFSDLTQGSKSFILLQITFSQGSMTKNKIYLDQKVQKKKVFKWEIDVESFVGCVRDVEDDLGERSNTFALPTLQIRPLFIDESHDFRNGWWWIMWGIKHLVVCSNKRIINSWLFSQNGMSCRVLILLLPQRLFFFYIN